MYIIENYICDRAEHWDSETSQPGMKNIVCWQSEPPVNSPLELIHMAE